MAATPSLICKQCNYANEPERVYCHNCGAKLDRTLLPKTPASQAVREVERNRKRVRRMVTPSRGFFANWFQALLNVLVSAVVAAALIQIARPPAGVPPVPSKEELLQAPGLIEYIEDAQMSTAPEARTLNQATINLYLATAVHSRSDAASDYFKFDRAFINLGQDSIKITAQESAFDYPIYAATVYRLSISGGKLLATNLGGYLGRLPVHPLIMAYCDAAFSQLWDALKREKDLLDKMESITIQPDAFTFVTHPHA